MAAPQGLSHGWEITKSQIVSPPDKWVYTHQLGRKPWSRSSSCCLGWSLGRQTSPQKQRKVGIQKTYVNSCWSKGETWNCWGSWSPKSAFPFSGFRIIARTEWPLSINDATTSCPGVNFTPTPHTHTHTHTSNKNAQIFCNENHSIHIFPHISAVVITTWKTYVGICTQKDSSSSKKEYAPTPPVAPTTRTLLDDLFFAPAEDSSATSLAEDSDSCEHTRLCLRLLSSLLLPKSPIRRLPALGPAPTVTRSIEEKRLDIRQLLIKLKSLGATEVVIEEKHCRQSLEAPIFGVVVDKQARGQARLWLWMWRKATPPQTSIFLSPPPLARSCYALTPATNCRSFEQAASELRRAAISDQKVRDDMLLNLRYSLGTRSLEDKLRLRFGGGFSRAIVNQHPPVHHQGWMICDQETVFSRVPFP